MSSDPQTQNAELPAPTNGAVPEQNGVAENSIVQNSTSTLRGGAAALNSANNLESSQAISAGKLIPFCFVRREGLIIRTDEIALYDRQIRLWGVAAQEKCVSPHCMGLFVDSLPSGYGRQASF